MKIPRTVFAGFLLLLLNFAVLCYAQEEKNEATKPTQQDEGKPQDVKPERSTPDNPAREEKRPQGEQGKEQKKDQERQGQEEKTQRQDENQRGQQTQGRDQNEQREQNRATALSNERSRNQAQRIPDDKFRTHFGREHHFRVSQPVIVENRPRFQYSGYWFEFVDAWPADWSYSDDCYIDYLDGQYFLFDALHPGVRLAVVVVF